MEPAEIRAVVTRLLTAAEYAAAIGIHLRRLSGELELPADLARRVEAVAEGFIGDTSDLDPRQAARLATIVRAILRQAADFAADPVDMTQWATDDDEVLQAMGQVSEGFAPIICQLLPDQLEGLAVAMSSDAFRMLDVGVGVAELAISVAQMTPSALIVGIDNSAAALRVARRNIEAAGLSERIDTRDQDVIDLRDVDTYDLVWFAAAFIAGSIQAEALHRCAASLRPGGWLVYNAFAGHDPATTAMANLRTMRSGGPVLTDDDIMSLLSQAGLVSTRVLPANGVIPSRFIVGRRP